MELNCNGYRTLLAAVEHDIEKYHDRDYRAKLTWVIERAKHYAEKTGVPVEFILDAWERRRDYWYMNYYQESNQPLIEDRKIRVFDTGDAFVASVGKEGFRCPACGKVSRSPYQCDAGTVTDGKVCDWKVYGLFGHLGKGIAVFVKENAVIEKLFMPVAWEKESNGSEAVTE